MLICESYMFEFSVSKDVKTTTKQQLIKENYNIFSSKSSSTNYQRIED